MELHYLSLSVFFKKAMSLIILKLVPILSNPILKRPLRITHLCVGVKFKHGKKIYGNFNLKLGVRSNIFLDMGQCDVKLE